MNKLKYIAASLLVGFMTLTSCEDAEIPQVDTENGRAIAGFNGAVSNPKITFNPTEDVVNTITVGVSTVSSVDRAVVLNLNEDDTTLPSSYYEISTLNPVIPAGSFTTDITITAISSLDLPSTTDIIALDLVSVQDSEILSESEDRLNISFNIQCSTVETENIPGTYRIIEDGFDTSVGDDTFEIIAGPGANQYTMVNPFDHPNPADGGAQSYDVIIDIDATTGVSRIERQDAWYSDNFPFPVNYGDGRIDGSGLTLTCINQIQFLALRHTVDAGSFGSYTFIIEKQ
ncbi:DUF1735 domain-containing protein [uncultured Dokdonia sp.]|uniref:DUF1735 domain-containing protein n=1 Tax=uncultured Dokdonia sp. TaxID=575653 RepID=UPI0030ED045C|tara:strand:+ start:6852 stop:7712 length:861 start_codon:yes stop_codon:yes gene_type:complete